MVGENVVFINYVKSAVLSDTHTHKCQSYFGSRTTTVRAFVHANQWTASERSACLPADLLLAPRARVPRPVPTPHRRLRRRER